MSFSSNVKSELSHHFGNARHCNIAEIAAIINMCGHFTLNHGKICVKIQTEKVYAARKYFTLLKKTFNIDSEILIRKNARLNKNKVYMLFVKDENQVEKLLRATGILRAGEKGKSIRRHINPLVVSGVCCKRAYIRGAFLAGGSLSDPEKSYHMEFVSQSLDHARELKDLINFFGMDSKLIKRKENNVVYLKEGEQIVDLLNVMEAHVALMELENIRILKGMRNSVNRMVNCETANLSKTIKAAVKQAEDISYIKENMGFSGLPESLEEIAELRLEYPDMSLKELGAMLTHPVGKSGVNHRLRKLGEIADEMRGKAGDSRGK